MLREPGQPLPRAHRGAHFGGWRPPPSPPTGCTAVTRSAPGEAPSHACRRGVNRACGQHETGARLRMQACPRRHQGRPTTHKALASSCDALPERGRSAARERGTAPVAWHAMTGAARAGPSARTTGPKGARAGALRGPALAGHQRPAPPRPAPRQLHIRARAQRRVRGAAAGGARAARARARRVCRLRQARAAGAGRLRACFGCRANAQQREVNVQDPVPTRACRDGRGRRSARMTPQHEKLARPVGLGIRACCCARLHGVHDRVACLNPGVRPPRAATPAAACSTTTRC